MAFAVGMVSRRLGVLSEEELLTCDTVRLEVAIAANTAMSELAAVLTRLYRLCRRRSRPRDLAVVSAPVARVHGLAERSGLAGHDRPAVDGRQPTVRVGRRGQGAWLAGAAVSILPGPVRGANDQRADALTVSSGLGCAPC